MNTPIINESVLLCGIIKNAEKYIEKNIYHLVNTGKMFSKFKIIIYENNSTDNTKLLLNKYIFSPFFHIVTENIDNKIIKDNSKISCYTEITGSDHLCRIEQICNARNKIIDIINTSEYDNYNYVLWIDLDSNGWSLTGIIDSFNKKEHWDAIFANGIDIRNNSYYDLYALKTPNFIFGPEIIGEVYWNNLPIINLFSNTNLLPVISAFGGIGIYKKYFFKNFKYDCLVNDTVKEFYRENIKFLKINDNIKNLIINQDIKFPKGYKDEKTNIFWKANSGYNQPVVCEHVCFNLFLFMNKNRLFINPKMLYFSKR